jgi:type III pantothenate kinase
MSAAPLIAVDIGNARIKLGLFDVGCANSTGDPESAVLPETARTFPLDGDSPDFDQITAWLGNDAAAPCCWWVASVNRPATTQLLDWLGQRRPDDRVSLLSADALPLAVRVERPDMVGVDRLVDAVAVNRLRKANRPAVIVDVGTAITVDWVSADGAFLGGAILPGLRMSARAMHEFTDLLPLVDVSDLLTAPPALGAATIEAMQSGLFWGAVGAVRQLIEQLARELRDGSAGEPQVFLTGGAGPVVAKLLGSDAVHVPNLTLSGIAAAALRQIERGA